MTLFIHSDFVFGLLLMVTGFLALGTGLLVNRSLNKREREQEK